VQVNRADEAISHTADPCRSQMDKPCPTKAILTRPGSSVCLLMVCFCFDRVQWQRPSVQGESARSCSNDKKNTQNVRNKIVIGYLIRYHWASKLESTVALVVNRNEARTGFTLLE